MGYRIIYREHGRLRGENYTGKTYKTKEEAEREYRKGIILNRRVHKLAKKHNISSKLPKMRIVSTGRKEERRTKQIWEY